MAAADSHTLEGLLATTLVPLVVVVVEVARIVFLPAPPTFLPPFFWLGKGISTS